MHHKLLAWLLPLLLATGCCTAPRPAPEPLARPSWSFPPEARITQRAIFTARGRQFTLDGFLSRSETNGLRLLVTENFGQMLADVLVKPDGTVFVMQAGGPLRPKWIRQYVARDLAAIFSQSPPADPAVTMPGASHFLIHRRWYSLDLRIVDIKPGPQPAESFDETHADPP